MTTFAYKIILDDSEIIMLESALKLMITTSEKELQNEPKAPHWANKYLAEKVLKRLHSDKKQMSGNNFM